MKVILFGIVKDIIGESELQINLEKDITISELQTILFNKYPKLKDINKFAFAINENYANKSDFIKNLDTVAIIPPVSGG